MRQSQEPDLPQSLLKNLIDRNVEKREAAANELEQLVSKKIQHQDLNYIQNLISFFNNRYIKGTMENRKKAGLEALTAIAIGFRESLDLASKFIFTLINPILDCFQDVDSKVRFNAIKALYYVCKHLEEASLKAFNIIFLRLILKVGDTDEEVSKAIQLLNNSLKSTLSQNLADSIASFDLQHFIGLVSSYLKEQNTQVRQFLIDWINTIDEIPSIDLTQHLPTFMQDLMFTLGDKDKQLRSKAEECLKGFISGLKEKFYCGTLQNADNLLLNIVEILVRICMGKYCAFSKAVALGWFNDIFFQLKDMDDSSLSSKVPKHKTVIKGIVIEHFGQILEPVLILLGHQDETVRKAALEANVILSQIMQNFKGERSVNFNKVMPLLKDLLSQNRLATNSEYVLAWMSYLLENYNDRIHPQVNDIIQKVVNNLFLVGEGNIKTGTHILENVSFNDHYFDLVIGKILTLLYENRFGDIKVEQVIRKFCDMLNTERAYKSICLKLLTFQDEVFICQIVQALENILATEKSLKTVRQKLRKANENKELFDIFFSTFSYNPISTLTLCYMSEQYELAYNIIISFTPKFITTTLLTKVCRLVNLFESPIFVYVRLHLLKRKTYPYLIESIHALMMVLPQGQVYSLLKNRIELIDHLQERGDVVPMVYIQEMGKYLEIYQNNVKALV